MTVHSDRTIEILMAQTESLYKLRRSSIEIGLGLQALLDHFGLRRVTTQQVDEVLDSE